jgi:sugar phosphate isomerase/epimerase
MIYSRRHFVKLSLATVPLTAYAAKAPAVVNGVHLGCITYNWRDLPDIGDAVNQVDAWIKVLTEVGVGEIELMSLVIEPTALRTPTGVVGGTPEEQKAQQETREKLRQWRIKTPMSEVQAVKRKFNRAGIKIACYGWNLASDSTDEELEALFRQAKALEVGFIACSTQFQMANRLLPFAEEHKMIVAFHNSSNVKDANAVASLESLQSIYEMSKFFRINLDLGHMTAANLDAFDYFQNNHARISLLHFNDRKRDLGPSVPYGQGDAPFKKVLQLLKKTRYPIPCILEVDHKIPEGSTTLDEWKRCLAYLKNALV